jgi:hypothetical protein
LATEKKNGKRKKKKEKNRIRLKRVGREKRN